MTPNRLASPAYEDLSRWGNSAETLRRNFDCYSEIYRTLDPQTLAEKAGDLSFFHEAVRKHNSWFGMYMGDFATRLRGKRVLELGFGDGLNALFMARLGAKVTAVEIVESSVRALHDASAQLGLDINAIQGDLETLRLPSFDLVVGKAFLHHLDHEQERRCLEKCSSLLTAQGEARFVEPAVNSHFMDRLRWMIPVPDRPSSLHATSFAKWKEQDPHPPRDNSSEHFRQLCSRYFADVRVIPYGGIERLRRLAPNRAIAERFSALALRWEPRLLPSSIREAIARTQTISCVRPK